MIINKYTMEEIVMRKKCVSLILVFALLCSLFSAPITVNATENSLAPHLAVLEELNNELGTDYAFPSAAQMSEMGEDYADLVAFYTAMDMDDFREYVKNAYNNEMRKNNLENGDDVIEVEYEVSPLSYTKTQRYYYDSSTSNYLYITSTAYTADGAERYSSIDSYGYTNTSYPYYFPTSMTKTFNSGSTQVTCKFYCGKYVAKNLVSGSSYMVTVTFKASGGNVYSSSTI